MAKQKRQIDDVSEFAAATAKMSQLIKKRDEIRARIDAPAPKEQPALALADRLLAGEELPERDDDAQARREFLVITQAAEQQEAVVSDAKREAQIVLRRERQPERREILARMDAVAGAMIAVISEKMKYDDEQNNDGVGEGAPNRFANISFPNTSPNDVIAGLFQFRQEFKKDAFCSK